jgi:hypothetical protein
MKLCILRIATTKINSLPTPPNSREERRTCKRIDFKSLSENQFQIRHHGQLTINRNIRVTALERSNAKQCATGGLIQVQG